MLILAFNRLNLVVVRLPHVYGPYAGQWVGTALCLARVYQSMNDDMKWLWTKDLRTNTVHVRDATRALWDIASWYVNGKSRYDEASMGKVPTLNVVDKGTTTQGTIAEIIGQVFNIKTGFQGQLLSNLARLSMDNIVDDVNDDTLGPWADLLAEKGIVRPGPLTPFLEKELLKDTDLSMDGSRLEQLLDFEFTHPALTKALVEEVIESYQKMNWWP